MLIQRVRDEERDLIFNEFKDRKGELIKGVVRRFEKGNNLIVDLGRTEGVLPFREQTPRETYRPADRIVAYVKDIDREARGPAGHPEPERPAPRREALRGRGARDSTRASCASSPAPASRARARKIAVTSRDADVDPVGACVGMKGARVQAVVQELRGEKIDIVPFDRDPARFVCAAIQPAEVNKVIVDEADGRMELVVPDEKLSLAIGRKGQNVRLAAQLTGWKLDIISETQVQADGGGGHRSPSSRSTASARPSPAACTASASAPSKSWRRPSEQELARHPRPRRRRGRPQRIRTSAETTMERLRQDRIRAASSRAEPLTERERLLFIRGVGERTVQLLEDAGYKTVEDILREDEDKLAIKTGLGIKKARAIKQGAEHFLSSEAKTIEAARREAVKQQKAAAQEPSPGA